MVRGYVIYGILVCLLMGYANFTGWAVGDTTMAAVGPRGPGARGVYHK